MQEESDNDGRPAGRSSTEEGWRFGRTDRRREAITERYPQLQILPKATQHRRRSAAATGCSYTRHVVLALSDVAHHATNQPSERETVEHPTPQRAGWLADWLHEEQKQ